MAQTKSLEEIPSLSQRVKGRSSGGVRGWGGGGDDTGWKWLIQWRSFDTPSQGIRSYFPLHKMNI